MIGSKSPWLKRLSPVLLATVIMCAGLLDGRFVSIANACAFDLAKPERTSIDRILESETLVLARPDPENVFSYKVSEVLRGDGVVQEIPFLVHSLNRRLLNLNPDDAVLFGRLDGENWVQIGYVDSDFRVVLQTALQHGAVWGEGYPRSRFEVFEKLQSSENPKLRSLAIQELDKAPYDMLRGLDLQLETKDLLSELWTPAGYPYQPIRVLLLGLSDDDLARKEIYDYFARTQKWDWANNIGAFSAALVQLEGVRGVTYLSQTLTSDPRQPLDKLQGVVSAMAVQREGATPEVKQAIDRLLLEMVEARPQSAPLVAQQFSLHSDWSQQEMLASLLREKKLANTADLIVVSVYVAQAKSATQLTTAVPVKG